MLLTTSTAGASPTTTTQNGLCAPCNLNQELKVQQLAAFEPQHPGRYDREIELYQRQLEHAYRLCSRCERHVRRRLTRVKRTVLGSKLAQIGAHGLRAFDMHLSEQRRGANGNGAAATAAAAHRRRRRVVTLCASVLLVLAALAAQRTAGVVVLTAGALNRVLPVPVTRGLFVAYASVRALVVCVQTFGAYVAQAGRESLGAVAVLVGADGEGTVVASVLVTDSSSFEFVERLAQTTAEQQAAILRVFESDRLFCVAALAVCLLTAWLQRFRRATLLMLFGWSLRAVLSSLLKRFEGGDGAGSSAEMAVVADLMRCGLDALICLTTMWSALRRHDAAAAERDAFVKQRVRPSLTGSLRDADTSSNSGSFHRIYTEADTGDLSDDGDFETTIMSTGSQQRTPPGNVTMHNRSMNSTCSVSPSVFTPRTLRRSVNNVSAATRGGGGGGLFGASSVRSLNLSFSGDEAARRLNEMPATPSKYHSMQAGLNSTLYDVPDEFHSGLTQLNIRDTRYPADNRSGLPHHVLLGSTVGVAPQQQQQQLYGSFDQLARSTTTSRPPSIIGPARLRAPSTIHESTSVVGSPSRTSPSWLAGGYWSGQRSPQKRAGTATTFRSATAASQAPIVVAAAVGVPQVPLMSRTSSQSSGFESRDNDSRESSVSPGGSNNGGAPGGGGCGGGATSISPNDSVSQCGVGGFAEPPYRPNSRSSCVAGMLACDKRLAAASVAGGHNGGDFEPGSLLRSWQMRSSQLDVSGRT